MKKMKMLALGLLGASFFAFTSCSPDDDDEVFPRPNLTITASTATITGDANGDIEIGSNETVSFTIQGASAGGTRLKSIALTVSGVNPVNVIPNTSEGYDLNDIANLDNADEDLYNDVLTIDGVFFSQEGVTNFRFTLTDDRDQSQVVDIAVTVNDPTPLANEKIGAFFHVEGSLQGAYDLVAATPVPGAPGADVTVQDMRNTDGVGETFTGKWTAGNATAYVKDNSYDYDNATEESALAAYAAGTASQNVNNPLVGDIYIAKLRGGDEYAVVKITNVDPLDNTCQCVNRGKIEFDFKKK